MNSENNQDNRGNKNKQKENMKVSTQPYKGVRDFYPKDWRFQKWLFWQMSSAAELFGYENYTASPLEYSELYIAKSGQEIVDNETYNLIDRGDRSVTLRPEMTPTVARMIAAQVRELPKPIRWYSIPNLFRYEKPQRGRLREHYQFNADIFGIEGIEAEIELIEMGAATLKNMGLSISDFEIKINNRKIWKSIFKKFTTNPSTIYNLSKLIDKKKKLSKEDFEKLIIETFDSEATEYPEKIDEFLQILETKDISELADYIDTESYEKTKSLIESLQEKGFTNAIFDITLMRGFDYYTDIVFEFFDTNPENNRSMCGGGRYDDLLDIFAMDKIPAVGFGMGDVTALDSLKVRGILPELKSKTKIAILPVETSFNVDAEKFATKLRSENINCEIDFSDRKLAKKILSAENREVTFFMALGEDEKTKQKYTLKNMVTSEKFEELSFSEVAKILKD
jgi:histidyl-tRNA synthetase